MHYDYRAVILRSCYPGKGIYSEDPADVIIHACSYCILYAIVKNIRRSTPVWRVVNPARATRIQGFLCIRRMTSVGSRMFHLTSVPTCIDSETREINLCPVLTPERGSRADQKNSLEDVVWA
jgi:hypothetical protein